MHRTWAVSRKNRASQLAAAAEDVTSSICCRHVQNQNKDAKGLALSDTSPQQHPISACALLITAPQSYPLPELKLELQLGRCKVQQGRKRWRDEMPFEHHSLQQCLGHISLTLSLYYWMSEPAFKRWKFHYSPYICTGFLIAQSRLQTNKKQQPNQTVSRIVKVEEVLK